MVLDSLPGWDSVLGLAYGKRLEALRDPACRASLEEGARRPGPRQHFSDWGGMKIVEAFTPQTQRFEGQVLADIARAGSTTRSATPRARAFAAPCMSGDRRVFRG